MADQRPRDPVRSWILGLLGAAVLLFAYTVVADRLTPSRSQATVQAFLVRMAPEVPGRVVEVGVADNQIVEAGALLFRLDPRTFEIAVARAEAGLAQVGLTLGASIAAVETAQAKLAEALAARDNAREQTGRVMELVRRNVYPRVRGDDAKSSRWPAPRRCTRAPSPSLSARASNSARPVPTIRNCATRSPRWNAPNSTSCAPA